VLTVNITAIAASLRDLAEIFPDHSEPLREVAYGLTATANELAVMDAQLCEILKPGPIVSAHFDIP